MDDKRGLFHRFFFDINGQIMWTAIAMANGLAILNITFFRWVFFNVVEVSILEFVLGVLPFLILARPGQKAIIGAGVKIGDFASRYLRKEAPTEGEPAPPETAEKAPTSSATFKAPTKKEKFVVKLLPYALEAEKQTGVSSIFILAQGGLERGFNATEKGNNLFGITANSTYSGEKALRRTKENHDDQSHKYLVIHSITWDAKKKKYVYDVERYFRVYASISDCFVDYLAVLQKPHFSHAWPHRADPKRFATELQSGRRKYATGSNYVPVMHQLIDEVKVIISKIEK